MYIMDVSAGDRDKPGRQLLGSVEDQSPGSDQCGYPACDSTYQGQESASRLPSRQNGPPTGWGECLLEALPAMLTAMAPEEQAAGVVSAKLALPGDGAAPDGRCHQEIRNSAKRENQDDDPAQAMQHDAEDRGGQEQVAPVASEQPG